MHKRRFRKAFYLELLLCFFIANIGIAQTPSADIDSITEDSYQRMLARQKAERELDSVRIDQLDLALPTADVKKQNGLQYLMLAFLIIGIGFLFWYMRHNSFKIKK